MCCIVLQSSSVYYHIGGRAGFLQTSPPLTVVRENTLYQHLSLTSSCLQDTRKYEPFDRIFPCAQRARIMSSFPFPLTSYDKKKRDRNLRKPVHILFKSDRIGIQGLCNTFDGLGWVSENCLPEAPIFPGLQVQLG